MTAIDPNAAYEALQALEQGVAEPGQCFDWNRGWVHGYAARDVAQVLGVPVTWRAAYEALEVLAKAGRVARVKVTNPQRDQALVELEAHYGQDPDHVVATYRTVGG